MNFLPAIPLFSVLAIQGAVGVAVNKDGSLLALVDSERHCVQIYSVVGTTCNAAPVIVGTAGTAGCLNGQFNYPRLACFVNRNGADTILISDWGNDRIVEVTARGDFLRFIAMKGGSRPYGVAYCSIGDVIAVSLSDAHAVVLLQYETGAVKPEVTIGSGTGAAGRGDGQLYYPYGVTFTADGRYILVADCLNHRVSKFSASSGAFIAHVISKGISYPRDVLECEDGSIVVAHGRYTDGDVFASVVGEDGGLLQNIIIPIASKGAVIPVAVALSYSPSLSSVVVKISDGKVFLLRDVWMASSRSAWLSALAIR
jgi:DNA-binding beta-propeller fold protein YncE